MYILEPVSPYSNFLLNFQTNINLIFFIEMVQIKVRSRLVYSEPS